MKTSSVLCSGAWRAKLTRQVSLIGAKPFLKLHLNFYLIVNPRHCLVKLFSFKLECFFLKIVKSHLDINKNATSRMITHQCVQSKYVPM